MRCSQDPSLGHPERTSKALAIYSKHLGVTHGQVFFGSVLARYEKPICPVFVSTDLVCQGPVSLTKWQSNIPCRVTTWKQQSSEDPARFVHKLDLEAFLRFPSADAKVSEHNFVV